jgi:uncharacterized protein
VQFLRWILVLVTIAYAALVVALAIWQRRLVFVPTQATEAGLIRVAREHGLVPWRNAQGNVIGWYSPNRAAKRRLVVFQGNAGMALDRAYYSEGLEPLDFEVHLFEYPGYGARAGSPSKEAFLSAGRAALDDLLAADARPLALLGESIGSGTACALAAQLPNRIAGVVLVVPFARLAEVAQTHLPFVPAGRILRDRFDNIAALAEYHGPVVFVVAENDEVVGLDQGLALYRAYAGQKELITLPEVGHNTFPTHPTAAWWAEAARFLR